MIRKTARILVGITLSFMLWMTSSAQEAKQGEKKDDLETLRQQAMEETLKDLGLVTVVRKDAHVKEIIDDLRRQTKTNLVLDLRNITDKDVIKEINLKDVPFRAALDQILELTGMVIEEEKANLIRIAKPQQITYEMVNAPVRTVIEGIARMGQANIIISPKVTDVPITLKVKNVPWNEVLDAVVKTANLSTVRERFSIIRVVTPSELQQQLETRIFQLEYIQPPPELKAQIQANQYIGGKIKLTADQVKEFTLLNILQTVLTKDKDNKSVGKLDYDLQSNAIVVTDTKPVLDKIADIITKLDRMPEQILIDVKFISTTNDDVLNFGMSYAFGDDPGFTVRSSPVNPSHTTRTPFGFGHQVPNTHALYLTEYDIQATFRAFKQDRFTKLIQQPTLAMLDNTEATIFVGEDVPYATTTAAATQTGATTFAITEGSKSPVKVGFQLLVKPHVVKGTSNIMLTVIPQNEFLSGASGEATVAGFERFTIQGGGPGGTDVSIDLPRIARTTVVTQMMLESGRTAVIGGLVNERTVKQDDKIPFLGDLPIFGNFFSSKNDTSTRSNLLIFITPRIVKGGKLTTDSLDAMIKQRLQELEKAHEEMKQREGIDEMQKRRSEELEKEHEELKKND